MTLAGEEFKRTGSKVIDVAMKYGYESPDSFAKAFKQFHGILPSQARNDVCDIKFFPRLELETHKKGGQTMNYRIEEKPEMILTGFKNHFSGVPFGKEREQQEEALFVSTRAKQWLLRGARYPRDSFDTDTCVITNVNDEGYDFYYAADLGEWNREVLYDESVTGFKYMDQFEFEHITIPKQTYAIFSTERQTNPIDDYMDIRQRIVMEWLPQTNWLIADAPEISVYYWYPKKEKEKRFIEIWMPIEERATL